MIFTGILSFTRWDIITPPKWVFLGQYSKFVQDSLFWKVCWNTSFYILLSVPPVLILSLFLALLVNKKLKGITVFRAVYFLPVITSMVAIALVWSLLYSPDFGPINYFLYFLFRIDGPKWLDSTTWALPALAFMSIWKFAGYYMVIFLAGLQGIPEELYEASRIDGASKWSQLWCITVPLLSPTIFFVSVICVIFSFQIFDQTYIMTQGGPAYSTLTLSYWIYQHGFEWFEMGRASALAACLFLMMLIFTLLQFGYQHRWVFYT